MLVCLVCATAEGHTDICGLLPLETMLRSMVHAVARSLGKVCSVLLLKVQERELAVCAVALMTPG